MGVARVVEFPLERRLHQQASEPCPVTEAKVLPFRPRRRLAEVTPFAGIELPQAVCGEGMTFVITGYSGFGGFSEAGSGLGTNPWKSADPGAD